MELIIHLLGRLIDAGSEMDREWRAGQESKIYV
jgi:hypothetical protein